MRLLPISLLVVAISLLIVVEAFKAGDFRTCENASFCRRHRVPADQKFPTDLASCRHRVVEGAGRIAGDQTQYDFTVEHTHTKRPLAVSVRLLEENVWRVVVDEAPVEIAHPLIPQPAEWNVETDGVWEPIVMKQPIRNRFRATEALVDSISYQPLIVSDPSPDADSYIIVAPAQTRETTLRIHLSPFRISILRWDTTLIAGLNHHCLLRFESYRPKDQSEHWETEEGLVDKTDLWEEKWSKWTDTKPHGPASVGMDVSFPSATHAYGIPERATSFALKPTRGEGVVGKQPYRLFNLDVHMYEMDQNLGLYASIPTLMAHGVGGTSGMTWLNPSDTHVDIAFESNEIQTHWISEAGVIDLFVAVGPTPKATIAQLASFVGTHPLPPLFSLGYHQCRWNYKNEADVMDVHGNFDIHNIPVDVIWLDIEHTDGKKYFTWERLDFPDPIRMQNTLANHGRKMVTIIDPHIKCDDSYHVRKEGNDLDIWVNNANGGAFEGDCWPGRSRWLDYVNPKAREYWSRQFHADKYSGSGEHLFTWNDMNEPSVFSGPEVSLPLDAKHHGDVEHREMHNMYGFLMTKATFEGQLSAYPNRRPFILSRALYAGSQRYVAVWTGDNDASAPHLLAAVPMILALAVGGVSFAGADVGGFFGNPDANLLVRWYQMAAYQPFFRGHAHIETKRREPWLFGDENTARIRNAIRTRYEIMPYVYTLFHEHSTERSPVMRPTMFEFPTEAAEFAREDVFLFGPALLVKPIVEVNEHDVQVHLPGGPSQTWYERPSGRKHMGGEATVHVTFDAIPVFHRGGFILPEKRRPRRSTRSMTKDPYTLSIALDSAGVARGVLYVDDGESFAYKSGAFALRSFKFENGKLTNEAGAGTGTFHIPETVESIVVLGVVTPPTHITTSDSTPIVFHHDAANAVLHLSRVALVMGNNWSIDFPGIGI